VFGAQKYAVRVSVDPERLAATASASTSAERDRRGNVNLPTGIAVRQPPAALDPLEGSCRSAASTRR
jgi:multidrug efflux pump subunit AcrB